MFQIITGILLFVVDIVCSVVLKKSSEDVYKALKERFSKTKERDEG